MILKNICIAILVSAVSPFTMAEVNKTCTEEITVEAVCAGEGDNHPEDPMFDPLFVYYSKKSYDLIKKLELEGKRLKNEPAVCDSGGGYLIYDLFGKDRLPDSHIDFDEVTVELVVGCNE